MLLPAQEGRVSCCQPQSLWHHSCPACGFKRPACACPQIRAIWRYYFERIGFHGIIFMADSTNREHLAEAKNELHRLLQEVCEAGVHAVDASALHPDPPPICPVLLRYLQEGLRALPLLVLANKQDLPYALDAGAVADALGMHHMRSRPWWVWSTLSAAVHAGVCTFAWSLDSASAAVSHARHSRCSAVCRHVQACCATNGMGLRDGLEWLSRAVAAQRRAAPAAGGAASRASAAAQVESSALPGL